MRKFLYYLNLVYCYIWFYTEFAVKNPAHRRPFTFVMRDHPWIYLLGTIVFCATMVFVEQVRLPLTVIWGLVSAHLWWGSKIIKGEQEHPPFLGFNQLRLKFEGRKKVLKLKYGVEK